MDMITVGLDYKAIALNSLLIAVLPVALTLGLEYWATKRISSAGLLFSAAIFLLLEGGLLYQSKGKVFTQDGELHVQSGFYKAAWPLAGLTLSTMDTATMGDGVRVNGIATYGLRTGWFQFAGSRVFVFTTRGQTACIQRDGEVLLCLDQDVVAQVGKWL